MISFSTPSSGASTFISSTKTTPPPSFGKLAKLLLNDLGCSAEETFLLFKKAFDEGQQDALNDAICSISAKSGRFVVSGHVKKLLREEGIELIQHSDATVLMLQCLIYTKDEQRHDTLDSVLSPCLPDEMINLIQCYDRGKFEFSDRNFALIKKAFESDDPLIKSQLIRNAIEQDAAPFLKDVFTKIRSESLKKTWDKLDLSGTDLHGLKLDNFDFSFTNLTDANLDKTTLQKNEILFANFTNASFVEANLQNCRIRLSVVVNKDVASSHAASSNSPA